MIYKLADNNDSHFTANDINKKNNELLQCVFLTLQFGLVGENVSNRFFVIPLPHMLLVVNTNSLSLNYQKTNLKITLSPSGLIYKKTFIFTGQKPSTIL